LLGKYLEANGITASIHRIAGSVEIAPAMGVAEAVCDLVTTGGTLLTNGLREVAVIASSSAVMIGNPALPRERQRLLVRLLLRVDAVIRARQYKYIMLNAPRKALPAITRLLPGMKSPTVSGLRMKGWVSVQSVVKETQFWDVIDELHELGAQGVLVLEVEKMVF
jgi:ATP phosphoribosyltransferase